MKMKLSLGEGGRRGRWLPVLGTLLAAYAMFCLYTTDAPAQFIGPAPRELTEEELSALPSDVPPPASELTKLKADWDARRGELGENAAAGMAAFIYDASVSGGGASETATLVCVGEGWFDAHPRYLRDGYLFQTDELINGARRVVLDEKLAFKLFPTREACGERVEIGGESYLVIGVVRRADSPGDPDAYRAYIPLAAAADARMQADYVQMDCLADSEGTKRALESVAEDVLENGTYYDISKEVMRASMLPRVLVILFALYFIGRLLRAWNRRTTALIKGWREEVLRRYFKEMLPGIIGLSLMQIAGYAALAGAAWAVMSLIIEPMYVFTEWIPEVIVEWSSIAGRVKDLLLANARIAEYRTREYASVRLYGALLRWGVVCILSGCVLFRTHPPKKAKK